MALLLCPTAPEPLEPTTQVLPPLFTEATVDDGARFGRRSATEVAEVRVTWPDGTETVLQQVAANQRIEVP